MQNNLKQFVLKKRDGDFIWSTDIMLNHYFIAAPARKDVGGFVIEFLLDSPHSPELIKNHRVNTIEEGNIWINQLWEEKVSEIFEK